MVAIQFQLSSITNLLGLEGLGQESKSGSSNWTGSRSSEHVVPELLKSWWKGFPGSSTCG